MDKTQRMEYYALCSFLHYSLIAMSNMNADYNTMNEFKDAISMAQRIATNYYKQSAP